MNTFQLTKQSCKTNKTILAVIISVFFTSTASFFNIFLFLPLASTSFVEPNKGEFHLYYNSKRPETAL